MAKYAIEKISAALKVTLLGLFKKLNLGNMNNKNKKVVAVAVSYFVIVNVSFICPSALS